MLGAEAVVLYILLVAIVNLGLGFAAAVYVARRYRELVALSPESAGQAPLAVASASSPSMPVIPETAAEESTASDPPTAAAVEADKTEPASIDEASSGGSPPGEDLSVKEARLDDAPPDPPRQLSPGEAWVQELRNQVGHYHEQLTCLDTALRDADSDPDDGTVLSLATSLKEANAEYLKSREPVREAFQSLCTGQEELADLDDPIRAAIRQQDAEIERASHVIEGLDRDVEAGEWRRRMLCQTANLLKVNDGLRDTLEEASVGVARNAHQLASLDAAEQTDSLTDLSSRAGLERTLAEWWQKDPLRVRQLTMATIDVDELGRLNDRVGRNVCDRILRAMAQLLKAASRGHSMAARFSGQRFVLLFADVDLRFTTNVAERIRQTIEMARFASHGGDIRVTVSCGVIEATSEDTSDALYARAEATLREAKRYGRNRTFIHEGKYPTPVVPPNFALEEKSVPI